MNRLVAFALSFVLTARNDNLDETETFDGLPTAAVWRRAAGAIGHHLRRLGAGLSELAEQDDGFNGRRPPPDTKGPQ